MAQTSRMRDHAALRLLSQMSIQYTLFAQRYTSLVTTNYCRQVSTILLYYIPKEFLLNFSEFTFQAYISLETLNFSLYHYIFIWSNMKSFIAKTSRPKDFANFLQRRFCF
jgi:hypothetical protein